jgi:hypothetical protein
MTVTTRGSAGFVATASLVREVTVISYRVADTRPPLRHTRSANVSTLSGYAESRGLRSCYTAHGYPLGEFAMPSVVICQSFYVTSSISSRNLGFLPRPCHVTSGGLIRRWGDPFHSST